MVPPTKGGYNVSTFGKAANESLSQSFGGSLGETGLTKSRKNDPFKGFDSSLGGGTLG